MSNSNQLFETRCIHSLEKVFADEPLQAIPYTQATVLLNETFSFQVAYQAHDMLKNVKARAISELGAAVMIRTVGLVPSDFPIYADHDEHVLRTAPGLYPDPLYPLHIEDIICLPNQWRSLWVTVEANPKRQPGRYSIDIVLETEGGEILGEEQLELEVLPASLPKQQLVHTQWFHTDCIATAYGVEVWSEEHWRRVEQFVTTAVDHGINMLLTPLFTPPLDTKIGGERPTVQLVDVERIGDTYQFGFDKLKRWVEMALQNGIEYIEFSHLFTQWGAEHSPKITAAVNGQTEKIFGWETDAAGDEYGSFLAQFLPELVQFIEENGLKEKCYFHISDEPFMKNMEPFRKASQLIDQHLQGFSRIEALSDYSFYEQGLVPTPIPATNHIEPFLEHNVPGLWTYYCCMQYKGVANRFFTFPSARNRIIGIQLYKFQITGFLQWGYNFWYSQYSIKAIDPFRVTDCGGSFPSGDAFLVYPGADGPIESLRMEVFYDALQDLRALQLLETRIGREAVLELLEDGLEQPITFDVYPREAAWLLNKREQVNRMIAEHHQEQGELTAL
ncbi:DUF4091 domain-containing protein [Paenibacillus sp. LHD-38]|uniref:DUF4091 domain-containing protein n=1 Tax=Paenibacillus sp. LHD-38 TaxID=3072143 RepID=UPI0035BE8D30